MAPPVTLLVMPLATLLTPALILADHPLEMLPSPPLTVPLTVQLVIRDGVSTECWQTAFSLATRNDPSRFSAKGP